MGNNSLKRPRIDSIDALRGFAVMAILLVHNVEHFIFPVYPENSPAWLHALDQGVMNVVFTLFAGKAYAIFALLFGFTFYLQMHNQRSKGKDFGYRFLWRLVLLIGFATLNAAFFPAGDVLLLFVVVGLVLFLMRNRSVKTIGIAAFLFLLQPVEWFHYVAHLLNPSYQLPDLQVGAMYAAVAEYTKNGSLGDFFLGNITLGQKASLFWAVGAGRFLQTAGLFLLGYFIGKRQLFLYTESNYRIWIKALIVSAVAFAPLFTLKDLVMANDPMVQQTVGTVLDMWQKLAFTIVLVSSFLILYQNERVSRSLDSLRFYGRMSLTNYITQSIIGALVYFPMGLYLAPYCGYTVSFLLGMLTFWLQVLFCKWWLSAHRQGPLESLWHKWTWMGTKA